MISRLLLLGVLICLCFGTSIPDCTGHNLGYYCVSRTKFYWCYGNAAPSAKYCTDGLECKCGFTTDNPCVWSSSVLSCPGIGSTFPEENDTGEDYSSSSGASGDNLGTTINGQFAVSPTEHLPLVIHFDKKNWRTQLKDLMSKSFYNDPNQYKKVSDSYECSFHPPSKYDTNPSQLWIGRPSGSVTISYTPGVTVRLPDRYFGLFLGYAMDHYGLNPGMLLGLAAKESFMPVIYLANDNSYFIVDDENAHYDCYASNKKGLCTDNNNDGPFQVETGGMSSDVSVFPQRFYTGSKSKPNRVPSYLTDNEFLSMSTFRALHDSYTLDMGLAVVLTSLDFHFRHNLLVTMKKIGFYDAYEKRTTREKKDSLEFAAAMYTYNRGIFDTGITNILKSCDPDADPAVDCKLDGYGGHSVNIRDACILVDNSSADEIYDYTVRQSDVEYFIDKLEESYPYDKVEPFYDSIPWDQIRSDAEEAFEMIKANRAKQSGNTYANGISFRYDWRALLSVIRMRLPPRETLVGPSVQTFTDYWGGKANPSMTSITLPKSFATGYCSLAGDDKELCSSIQESSSSSSSSSSSIPIKPSSSSSSSESSYFPPSSFSSSSSSSSSSRQQTSDDDGDECVDNVKSCKRKFYVCKKKRVQTPESCLTQWKDCIKKYNLDGTECFPNTFHSSFTQCLNG